MRCPDNYDAFCQHEADDEQWLKKLPVCCECRNPIQDEFCYEFDGDLYCEKCMDGHRKSTDDFIEQRS